MITKILGILIIVAAGAIAYLVLNDGALPWASAPTPCIQQTPAQQLAHLIESDFQQLGIQQELPAEWAQISEVDIRMGSSLAKALLGQHRPTFSTQTEGSAILEMEIMDLPDEDNPGIIIQASLFDKNSGNKVFEIGRTYTMNDLNKTN